MAILEEPIKETKVLKNYVDGEWVESRGEVQEIEKFYEDAILSSKSFLADVSSTLQRIAERRKKRLRQLRLFIEEWGEQ